MDGITCAALAKIKFPDIHLIGYDYGQPLDEIEAIPDGSEVYMMDVSLTVDEMEALAERTALIWIDHHKSKMVEIGKFSNPGVQFESNSFIKGFINVQINSDVGIYCHCEVGRAACELAMEFFELDGEVHDMAVKHLGMYDTWRKHEDWNTTVRFQFGMRAMIGLDVDKIIKFLTFKTSESFFDVVNIGKHIINHQREQARIVMQNSFKCTLSVTPQNESAFEDEKQYDCIAVNSMGLNTDLLPPEIDIQGLVFLQFIYQKDDTWKISMRSEGDLDVGELCSSLGGGGHKNAAGCIMQLGEKMEGFWEFKSLHKKSPGFLTLELYA